MFVTNDAEGGRIKKYNHCLKSCYRFYPSFQELLTEYRLMTWKLSILIAQPHSSASLPDLSTFKPISLIERMKLLHLRRLPNWTLKCNAINLTPIPSKIPHNSLEKPASNYESPNHRHNRHQSQSNHILYRSHTLLIEHSVWDPIVSH